MPYFIGLMGDRYGWGPKTEEVPTDIAQKYKWIPGMSMTALEYFYGAIWDKNPNVTFVT